MANVTDPLARAIHGTNPQNLIEYITRQRIYDSLFWKEECFGLTAADVAEKAATKLEAIGGTYGGNNKPTRFICLILKMLQIQPDDDVVDELINNEDFKYVRALGSFYLRLTGRPADIYEKLEPLLNDYRKLRRKNPSDWSLIHMDEFIDSLLRDERVCGIALPRLPKRDVLVEGGYLDGSRRSAMREVLWPESDSDWNPSDDLDSLKSYVARIEFILNQMAHAGNKNAKLFLEKRRESTKLLVASLDIATETNDSNENKKVNDDENCRASLDIRNDSVACVLPPNNLQRNDKEKNSTKNRNQNSRDEKKYGSLFKKSNQPVSTQVAVNSIEVLSDQAEKSNEYWNDERKKLGLKPLK